MVNIKKFFTVALFEVRKEWAIRKAQKEANRQRRKYLVLIWAGKPQVVSMQSLKRLIRQHRFTKGFTAERARELAIYEAVPRPLKK